MSLFFKAAWLPLSFIESFLIIIKELFLNVLSCIIVIIFTHIISCTLLLRCLFYFFNSCAIIDWFSLLINLFNVVVYTWAFIHEDSWGGLIQIIKLLVPELKTFNWSLNHLNLASSVLLGLNCVYVWVLRRWWLLIHAWSHFILIIIH